MVRSRSPSSTGRSGIPAAQVSISASWAGVSWAPSVSETKSTVVGSGTWSRNPAISSFTFVDSELDGRNAALSFSCALESFPAAGPITLPTMNQPTMTTHATQIARRAVRVRVDSSEGDNVKLLRGGGIRRSG